MKKFIFVVLAFITLLMVSASANDFDTGQFGVSKYTMVQAQPSLDSSAAIQAPTILMYSTLTSEAITAYNFASLQCPFDYGPLASTLYIDTNRCQRENNNSDIVLHKLKTDGLCTNKLYTEIYI